MEEPNVWQCKSNKFHWREKDYIGRGANGKVYKGIDYTRRVFVAVKQFSRKDFYKFQGEMEILRKLENENVVKVVDSEELKDCFFVGLEFCEGGSLESVLKTPENMFGLDDAEFLVVVNDLVSGLKYLQGKNIYHRDIKPDNTLRAIRHDGSSQYKLADFDHAEELPCDGYFTLPKGTFAYMHPTIFLSHYLGETPEDGIKFLPTCDIWSLGCTFYKVATGSLPFSTDNGKNRHDMRRIFKNKGDKELSGKIASTQSNIKYEEHLPSTCQLSEGLRQLVEDMLRKMLNTRQSISFKDLYRIRDDLRSRCVRHVFCAYTAKLHHLYLEPENKLDKFLPQLSVQTGLTVEQITSSQIVSHNGAPLSTLVLDSQHVCTYPTSTAATPYILLPLGKWLNRGFQRFHIEKAPAPYTSLHWDHDSYWASKCIGYSHTYVRVARNLVQTSLLLQAVMQILVREFHDSLQQMHEMFVTAKEEISEVQDKMATLKMKLDQNWSRSPDDVKKCRLDLLKLIEKLADVRTYTENCCTYMKDVMSYFIDKKVLMESWNSDEHTNMPKFKYVEQVEHLVKRAAEFQLELKDACTQSKKLKDDDNQQRFQKFNKESLSDVMGQSYQLVNNDATTCVTKAFQHFVTCIKMAENKRHKADHYQRNSSWIRESLAKIKRCYKQIHERHEELLRCNTSTAEDFDEPRQTSSVTRSEPEATASVAICPESGATANVATRSNSGPTANVATRSEPGPTASGATRPEAGAIANVAIRSDSGPTANVATSPEPGTISANQLTVGQARARDAMNELEIKILNSR